MRDFKIGQVYLGVGVYGDAKVEIVKKTEKTITVRPIEGDKTFRVKLSNCHKLHESFYFKAWGFKAA